MAVNACAEPVWAAGAPCLAKPVHGSAATKMGDHSALRRGRPSVGNTPLLLRPPQVTATVLVNVRVISSELFNTSRSPSEVVDPQTEAQLARSFQVVSAVSESMGDGTSPAEVREAITAELCLMEQS